MGRKQFIINLKSVLILLGFVPLFVTGQNYPRFELYQLKQGTDSGQFIVTGLDSNLAFNNILRFRSADSTFLIGTDTVVTDQSIIPILLRTIDAGLGIDVNQVDNQIFIESLSIEDSIYNGTGTLIAKGTPLYAVGVQGNFWSVAPADASDPNKMPVVVIAGEDIGDNATGLGLIKGHIKQVNTTGLADGAEVFVASGGGYTSTKPTAEGVIIQRLGTVIKGNSSNGSGIINLGDEAYWNDYTSLTKLRDTLVIFRDSVTNQIGDSLLLYVDRVELGDSLALYPNRIELGDTALAIRTDIPLIINDSLTARNFLTEEVDGSITNELQTLSKLGLDITLSDGGGTVRDSILTETQVDAFVANNGYLTTEVDGSITNELQTISTSGAAGNITLSDGGGTLNLNVNDADASTTNEIQTLSYNTTTDEISISGGNSIDITEVNQNQNITLSGDVSGSGTTSITTTVADDSHNHIIDNVDGLQTALNAKQDNLSGTGIVKSTGGTISYLTDNSSNWNNAYNDRITSASFSGTTIKTLTLNQQDGGTVTASFTDDTGGGLTGTNQGNNRIPTFKSADNIDGDNGFWINDHYELVDNLLDGTASSSVGYQLKLSHTAFIDSVETNYLDVNSNLTLDNNLTVLGSTTFDGTVGDSYFYSSGALGIQTTPSGNLSLTTRYGAKFNTDNNTQYGDVTMNGATVNNLFNLDASEDAIAIGGSTPNSSFDLKTYRGVWINESKSGATYDGLLVSGDLQTYLLNVDADRDKVGINKFQPAYTLDVTGDINFTNKLYQNGVEVTFGGTTINNNADYRIITGSNTANTLNGESNLTYDGSQLYIYQNNLPGIYLQNLSTGTGASNGMYLFSNASTFQINNYEEGRITLNNFIGSIILNPNGTVEIENLAGVSDIGADIDGVLQAATSDTTLKTNITPNQYGIEKVMDLETIKFNWKDKKSKGAQKEVGFNAQNLQKVIPEATYTIPSNGKLGIKDDAIIATLTKAIQEQQEMIEELQKELKRIKRKIK